LSKYYNFSFIYLTSFEYTNTSPLPFGYINVRVIVVIIINSSPPSLPFEKNGKKTGVVVKSIEYASLISKAPKGSVH
jgi:hypothetical protein